MSSSESFCPADGHFPRVAWPPHRKPTHTSTGGNGQLFTGWIPLEKLAIKMVDCEPRPGTGPCLQPARTSKDFIQVRQSPSSEVLLQFQEEELNCRKQKW